MVPKASVSPASPATHHQTFRSRGRPGRGARDGSTRPTVAVAASADGSCIVRGRVPRRCLGRRELHRRGGVARRRLGQRGLELGGRLEAIRRVLLQAAEDDGFERRRDRPDARRRGDGLVDVQVERRDRRVGDERGPSGEHLVQDAPQRVDVRARVARLAARLLGRQAWRAADDEAAPRDGLRARRPRDTEVDDLYPVVAGEHHVARLHVAMHHAALVRGG